MAILTAYSDRLGWAFGIVKIILGVVGWWLASEAISNANESLWWLGLWVKIIGAWMFISGLIRVRQGPTTAECVELRKGLSTKK